MNMLKKTTTGAAIALAAASLAGCMTSAPATQSASADLKCFGVNQCKGHNDCKTANNACAGQGSCKGMGFIKMSAEACDQVGGTPKS